VPLEYPLYHQGQLYTYMHYEQHCSSYLNHQWCSLTLVPPIFYNSIHGSMEMAITRVSPHVFIKFKMRIVVLIDFINEFGYCVWSVCLSHIPIMTDFWGNVNSIVIKKSGKCYLIILISIIKNVNSDILDI